MEIQDGHQGHYLENLFWTSPDPKYQLIRNLVENIGVTIDKK